MISLPESLLQAHVQLPFLSVWRRLLVFLFVLMNGSHSLLCFPGCGFLPLQQLVPRLSADPMLVLCLDTAVGEGGCAVPISWGFPGGAHTPSDVGENAEVLPRMIKAHRDRSREKKGPHHRLALIVLSHSPLR